jgi:hypothetical protein
MKHKFIMMPLLISGPVQVGNDNYVYLELLIYDLLVLWEKEGVRMWDEFQQQYFNLRAILFITIQDGPAFGSISGQAFKGYKGCTWCMDEICGIWLKHCRKVVYMGRDRFLRADHKTHENGSKKLPTICYTLSKHEKMRLCNCLYGIKVLTGYSDNISGMVNMKTLKVRFKKSQGCHILIGQFRPTAIRDILLAKVQDTIMKLCSFFNAISQKDVDPIKLTKLQDDLILMMCNLETFPHSFFNLMPHLLIHTVHEMKYLGPVFLHQMYPFERIMTVLKKYARN